MNNNDTRRDAAAACAEPTRSSRKEYRTPELTRFGTIYDLTRGANGVIPDNAEGASVALG